jgi:hypothetical protein
VGILQSIRCEVILWVWYIRSHYHVTNVGRNILVGLAIYISIIIVLISAIGSIRELRRQGKILLIGKAVEE